MRSMLLAAMLLAIAGCGSNDADGAQKSDLTEASSLVYPSSTKTRELWNDEAHFTDIHSQRVDNPANLETTYSLLAGGSVTGAADWYDRELNAHGWTPCPSRRGRISDGSLFQTEHCKGVGERMHKFTVQASPLSEPGTFRTKYQIGFDDRSEP